MNKDYLTIEEEFDLKFKNERFKIEVNPNVLSIGDNYTVFDSQEEMPEIFYDHDWQEAEEMCTFLNKQCKELQHHKKFKLKFRETADDFILFFNKYEESINKLYDKYKDNTTECGVLDELEKLLED